MTFVRKDSRYLQTKLLSDSEGKLYFDVWKSLEVVEQDGEDRHEISRDDLGRFDKLANYHFGNTNLWWVVPHSNRVEDPFPCIDWSEASEQPIYPNYSRMGVDAKIQYPDDVDAVKDKKLPEYEVGSYFRVPARSLIQKVLVDAQKKGNEE